MAEIHQNYQMTDFPLFLILWNLVVLGTIFTQLWRAMNRYRKRAEEWEREARKFEALWKLRGGK